ncbi:alanine racemase [Sphingomonas endophytica]|uniref:Alanine racemase n=1 Tax=Sphingomonas endophytica TaxID=869719 RepID=A0A147HZZ4_9SPHN|nr:alanine racemase [Sphingomonas endophytica]KTT70606.1 alanine racemase [Sphingomonas endophytica]
MPHRPNRLYLSSDALVANWRALARLSGAAACGAAVKADGYGLGAREVVARLLDAGCRDFFVANWAEAQAIADLIVGGDATIAVLHGVREADLPLPDLPGVRPVLSTPAQVARWRSVAPGGECDVMVDTGMNRLGVAPAEIAAGLLDGLTIDTLMSHLACADEPGHALNAVQRERFVALAGRTAARRLSLANSAGIALGADYHFDLTRPGLALYGGVPVAALAGAICPVATIAAEVLQCRTVRAGETVGYNATWTAPADTRVAIVNLGYADGYRRALSDRGCAFARDAALPVIGRVSMDLIALDISAADVREGDWVRFDDDPVHVAQVSGVSQYELLTGLGRRFARHWS